MGVKELTKEDVKEILRNANTAIISLSDVVRTVSVMFNEDTNELTFQTDKRSKKMSRLNDSRVNFTSLMVGNLCIDEAPLYKLGHPKSKVNESWLENFKAKHPNTVEKYSDIDTEEVLMVDVFGADELRMWEYDEERNPYIHSIKPRETEWVDNVIHGDTLERVRK